MSVTVESGFVEKLADHRLSWDRIEHQIVAALDHDSVVDPPDHHMGPFLAISRESGAGGGTFARLLGDALGWAVLDQEIVDLMADTFDLDAAALHLLDEAGANWVREVLGDLMPHQVINRDAFVHHLGKVMRLVTMHGKVVLVGRGAQLFLPRSSGLAVRLVAPLDDRIRRVRARDGVDETAARRHITEVDGRRAEFLEHYFGCDPQDPTLYDLVLNRSTLTDDALVDIVLAACRQRGYTV
jgi:cytidylate kinase